MSEGTRISRRRFLVLAGTAAAAGTAAVACGGLAALGRQQPGVEFVELNCGTERDAQGKTLIAYASQYGSTGGVADAIAQVLCEAGMAVDVKLVTNVTDLSEYRAVIVGSPVQNDAWRPEAISFVEANRDLLSRRPVAYFLTCMTLGLDPRPEGRERMARALEHVWEQIPEVVPLLMSKFWGVRFFQLCHQHFYFHLYCYVNRKLKYPYRCFLQYHLHPRFLIPDNSLNIQ